MVCSRWWRLTLRWSAFKGILDEHFPTVVWRLQCVEVKGHEIVEKEALDLTTKYVNFRAENIQRVTISARRTLTSRKCSRPMLCC